VHNAVERATALIRERFYDPLTLDDIADAAIMSRFHFSRLFRRTTGISPGRFLTAVRLHEAKRLLLTTDKSVVEISCLVGYTSLGAFTTRFTDCVGISPGKLRRLVQLGLLDSVRGADEHEAGPSGSFTGTLRVERGTVTGPVYLGVFDRPIPQGKPVACQMIPGPGEWMLDPVPVGEWYVMAVTMVAGVSAPTHTPPIDRPLLIAGDGPIPMRANGLRDVELNLHPPRPTDPPVLLTLPALLNLEPWDRRNVREDTAV
jgi:AraC family transcriptional regulator